MCVCVSVCVCKIVGGNPRVFGVTVHELASFSFLMSSGPCRRLPLSAGVTVIARGETVNKRREDRHSIL